MKQTKTRTYLSYLLRLWRDDAAASWRATLQNPQTGKRRGFAGLEQLIRFLEEQTGEKLRAKPEADD